MKRIAWSILLYFAIAFLLTVGARANATAIEPNASAHYTLLLSGPTVVKIGEPILIAIESRNDTKSTLGGPQPHVSCEQKLARELHLIGPNGVEQKSFSGSAKTQNQIVPMSGSSIYISTPPGSNSNEKCYLDRIFDMNAPGLYSVVLQRSLSDNSTVSSNILEISVTP